MWHVKAVLCWKNRKVIWRERHSLQFCTGNIQQNTYILHWCCSAMDVIIKNSFLLLLKQQLLLAPQKLNAMAIKLNKMPFQKPKETGNKGKIGKISILANAVVINLNYILNEVKFLQKHSKVFVLKCNAFAFMLCHLHLLLTNLIRVKPKWKQISRIHSHGMAIATAEHCEGLPTFTWQPTFCFDCYL